MIMIETGLAGLLIIKEMLKERRNAMDNLDRIFEYVKAELLYANDKWGTDFDDKNTLNDWINYIVIYLGHAGSMGTPKAEQRVAMIKALGLCMSAIDSFDRNDGWAPRHYEDKVAK